MKTNAALAQEIKTKIKFLVNQIKTLIKSNMQMQIEIEELKKTIENQKNTIEEIKHTNKIIKLANEMQLSDEDKKQLKTELTEKIKQIDSCIKMLSK